MVYLLQNYDPRQICMNVKNILGQLISKFHYIILAINTFKCLHDSVIEIKHTYLFSMEIILVLSYKSNDY